MLNVDTINNGNLVLKHVIKYQVRYRSNWKSKHAYNGKANLSYNESLAKSRRESNALPESTG